MKIRINASYMSDRRHMIIKQTHQLFLIPLIYLINIIFVEDFVRSQFQESLVIPVF